MASAPKRIDAGTSAKESTKKVNAGTTPIKTSKVDSGTTPMKPAELTSQGAQTSPAAV